MRFYYADMQDQHDAGLIHINALSRRSRDRPERGAVMLASVEAMGLERVPVRPRGTEILAHVHTPRYVRFLRTLWKEWMEQVAPVHGSPENGITANIFPSMPTYGGYPSSLIGRVGYHMHDQVAPVREKTFEIALYSASTAACAADEVLAGARECYALCRPSGHHAARESLAGSCYLNNAAVAAQRLRQKYDRVLLIDIDVHHGNGTQDIFYHRDDVYFISLHRDPADYVPYFWGYAHERGEGPGLSCNLNMPLPPGTRDDAFLDALETALAEAADFNAGALVISAGYDAYENDPCEGLKVTYDGFVRIGERLAQTGLPTVIVQEGGYAVDAQGGCVNAFLSGFLKGR